MTTTLNVRGMKLRTRTQRRYVVVFVRPEPVVGYDGRTYPAKIEVEYRTDSYGRAKDRARRDGGPRVVVDTTTGEEV